MIATQILTPTGVTNSVGRTGIAVLDTDSAATSAQPQFRRSVYVLHNDGTWEAADRGDLTALSAADAKAANQGIDIL